MNTFGESMVLWWSFFVLVLVLFLIDFLVLNRCAKEVTFRKALYLSAFWILLALFFNLFLYFHLGPQKAMEFLAGYLIEKALSVDNLFVFILIFSLFSVPTALQHRVMYLGVIGAIILRMMFIAAGIYLIHLFSWIMYIFGAFLIFTGIKIIFQNENKTMDKENNVILRWVKKILPMTEGFRGEKFLVRENGRLLATPLLFVLIVIDLFDLVFAVDSIPAVLAVTPDPFIVVSSNIFAILGLRAIYFLLNGMMGQFQYLKYALGAVLAFVGTKMVLEDFIKVGIGVSLGVVVTLLGASVAISILYKPNAKQNI